MPFSTGQTGQVLAALTGNNSALATAIAAAIASNSSAASEDYGMEIALGNIPTKRVRRKFGKIYDIDSGDGMLEIWSDPDKGSKTWLTGNEPMTIESSSGADTGTVAVTYIKDSGTQYIETLKIVTLAGMTPVAIDSAVAIFRVVSVGAKLVGNLSVFETTGDTLQAYVRATAQITQQSQFIIPDVLTDGFVVTSAQIKTINWSVFRATGSGAKIGEIIGFARLPGGQSIELFNQGGGTNAQPPSLNQFAPPPLAPRTEILLGIQTESNNTSAFTNMLLILTGAIP